jgi:hypothetical protein
MPKLSVRAVYYIAIVGVPLVASIFGTAMLLTTHYGDNLPLFFKIGAPFALGIVAVWFFLVQLPRSKLPKEWPKKP